MTYKILAIVSFFFFLLPLGAENCSVSEKDNKIIKNCINKKERILFDNSEYSYFMLSAVGDYIDFSRIPNDSPYGMSEEHFIFRKSDESVYSSSCLIRIIGLSDKKEGFVEVMRNGNIFEQNLKELKCNINYKKWLNGYTSKKILKTNSILPKFREFIVKETYKGKNQKLIIDDFSKQFRTRLKKLIKADKPTFAGKYLVARWGCGSGGCNMGAIIDASTGKVYSFPVSMSSVYPIRPDAEGEGQELIYKINSRLMIFAGDLEGEKNYPDSVLFYEFTGKEFKLLKVLPYGKATTSNKTEELKADKKPEPVSKIPTNKPAEVTQVALTTTPPKNAEIIKAEKDEPIKTAKGSTSFTLLATMFGLLSLRLKNIV